MADELGKGDGQPQPDPRPDSGGSGDVDTGLPVFPSDQKGSSGSADLRPDGKPVEELASVRDDAGREHPERSAGQPHQDADAGDGGGLRRGHDGNGGNGKGRGAYRLPALGKIDRADLPNVPDRYRQEAGKSTADDPAARLRDRDGVLADKLGHG